MRANDLRQLYLAFFQKHKHKVVPYAPLIPENDPTTLFTSSGMQPLVPYLLGEVHPSGKRLVNSQICFRSEDIDEVGDNRHTTFFEMLGNWSLGDYFKQEQLPWFFEFLTKEVGLDAHKLYVTVFQGNESINIPEDKESVEIWRKLFSDIGIEARVVENADKKGLQGGRIFYYSEDYGNWWSRSGRPQDMPVGEPGGPCSEVFYDFGSSLNLHEKSPYAKQPCHANCDCGRFLEIGNSVFMQYKKEKDGSFSKLPQKNVDFGGGFERTLAAKLNTPDIFKTDLFWPIITEIEKSCDKKYEGNEEPMRIIADHLKGATFMISKGLEPSNKLQGYILRRLLRRAAVKMKLLGKNLGASSENICLAIIDVYKDVYLHDIEVTKKTILNVVGDEMNKFATSLDRGLREIEKSDPAKVDGKFAFNLWQSYGFPLEIVQELLEKKGIKLDSKEFEKELDKHKELSRMASKGMFKGGLADHSKDITRLHTATHLLHAALRGVLGNHVQQVGSNITSERLRFDFIHSEKLTESEIKKIEGQINRAIKDNKKVGFTIMPLEEAKKQGALAFFGQKYPDQVKVYSVGDFSKELCGGPHVDFTGELGRFIIKKQQAVGSGRRRVYAVLKDNK